MFKEIFYNIVDFINHLWNQMHTSINDDFEHGGIAQVARNRYAISLFALLVVSMSVPFLLSQSPVEVRLEKGAEGADIPEPVVKQAVFMNASFKMDQPGEYSIGKLTVKGVEKKQVEGVEASVVSYEMEMAAKKQPKKQVMGTVTLAKQGDKWTVFIENVKRWVPVS